MKKKYLRKLIRKIISQLLILVLITNSLMSFRLSSFAQEATNSAPIAITSEPTPTTEPSPTILPTETPTILPTPTSEPTATPSVTIVPTPIITTSTPTPIQSIEPTSIPLQSTPTVSPTPEITPTSQSTMEALQNFINESSSSAGVIDYAIKLPFNGSYPTSLGFGETPDDPYLQQEYKSFGIVAHDGIDYELPESTKVLAADRGIVLSAGTGLYGTTITIYHTWGMTYYGHLSSVSVEPGQIVETGELIGYSGQTGLAIGPHLHFSIKPKNPDLENGFHGMVDPNIYLGLKPQSNILGASAIFLNKKIRTFKSSEKAEFEIDTKDPNLRYELKDSSGKKIAFTKKISKKDKKNILSIDQPANFRPGKYILEVTNSLGQVEEQEFYWGVLAINTNKSVYLPDETTYLQMASLDQYGHTLCDTNLKLEIINSQGAIATPNIERSDTCGANNVTDSPDYFAYYKTSTQGNYQMKLKNLDNDFEISDSFEVKENLPFEVERIGATRINPFSANYTMTFKIKANQDFNGEVIEKLPSGFEVIDAGEGRVKNTASEKEITWNLNLQKDQQTTLQYEYKAPEISPQIFLLGPARLEKGNKLVFEEARQWQIAADATCTSIAGTDWNLQTTWGTAGTGCVGATGGIPGAADAVIIASGHTVTVSDARSATSITINNAGATTGISMTTGTLNVSGALTLNAPSGTGATTVAVGSATLTVGTGITITSGINVNRVCQVTASTGTITVTTGGITFSGTATTGAKLTTTDAATINLTGTISAGGTVTINAGTTTKFTGTSAINGAYTFGIVQVNSGTTTLGAGTITFAGTLLVANTATLSLGNFAFTQTGATTVGSGTSGIISVAAAGSTGTYTFTGNITVNTGGTFDLSTGTHATSFGGTSYSHSGTTFNTGTGAMTITGTGAWAFAGSSNMTWGATMTIPTNRALTNNNTATVTIAALTLDSPVAANSLSLTTASTTTVTGALTYTANATANNQTITMNGTANLNAGSVVINAPTSTGSSLITCSGGSGTFNVTGTVGLTGSGATAGVITLAMDTCTFISGGLTTITGGATGGNVSITSSTGTLTFSAGLTFAGTTAKNILTTTGAGTINLTGTLGSGGTLSINSATTLVLTGTSAISGAYSFGNLTILSGTLTLNAGISVAGNWSNSANFDANLQTVTLNGGTGTTQTISGTNTFYTLSATGSTARTIKFPSGVTTTITNSLTLTGAASNLLTLAPSTASTIWTITPPATINVSYVSVSYSTATSCINATNSTNGGNNTLWAYDGGGCGVGPTLDQLMRHGTWFNSSGVKQPFTF